MSSAISSPLRLVEGLQPLAGPLPMPAAER
jgi:hypothetical protein